MIKADLFLCPWRRNFPKLHLMRQLSFFLTSCFNAFDDKQKVDIGLVDYVEIRKQFDTVSLRLTPGQAAGFVSHWNNSSAKGPYKFYPGYFLTIHFKGDSSLSFRTQGDLIKQNNDWSYSVHDKNYFKSLWLKQAGLSDNWFEYFPIYEKDGKFFKDTKPFDTRHLVAIKQVLSYYNHKWIDIRRQLFYEGKLDDELLWNYTTKANDSIWLSSHR